ncbi:MAG: esterase [Okeania sp. SIO2H7]|nr:esterase [Okeania sp. SIO2H7]
MNLPTNKTYIYLHAFASSPQSAKAKYIKKCFSSLNINLKIPDLNRGNFSELTLTRQLQQVTAEINASPSPVILIGSSFGGLTSIFLAENHSKVEKLILLAPAFKFLSHWLPSLGEQQLQKWQSQGVLPIYHYGENDYLPLNYDFVRDGEKYDEEKLERSLPTLILHGKSDEVIPIQASRDFAAKRPWVKLIALDSDHSLGNVMAEIWQAIAQFLT